MLRPLLLTFLFLAVPAVAQDAEAPRATTISVFPEKLVAGDQSSLTFDAPVQTVVVTYRPNSAIPLVDTVTVGGFESIRWTPERAGVVRVAVPGGPSRNLSVRFAALPVSGIVVLILAGLILFGGAAWAMTKLLSGGMPHTIPEVRPDT
jgi:hypothetical protein